MTSVMRITRLAFDNLIERKQIQYDETGCADQLSCRQKLLTNHGDFTLAYSTCYQEGLKFFGDQRGYIAFGQKMGHTFALGDPVCPDDCRAELIAKFVDHFAKRKPSFVQVERQTAEVLNKLGYRINAMGIDTSLDLRNYNFNGKSKERFRYAHNWLKRNQFQVREFNFAEYGRPRIRRLSVGWRRTRTVRKREVRFVNRPMVYRDQPDMRKFVLVDGDQRPVAFMGFDPLYRNQQVIGYVTTFKRRVPDAPRYAEMGMIKAIIETFIAEGAEQLNLGLSPLAGIEKTEMRTNWMLNWSMSRAFRAKWLNRWFYNVRGHAEYKHRFGGVAHPVFYASPVFVNDVRLIALLRLCKII